MGSTTLQGMGASGSRVLGIRSCEFCSPPQPACPTARLLHTPHSTRCLITSPCALNVHCLRSVNVCACVCIRHPVQATPLYLSEMAPFRLRGALNIMFQLAVTIGILAAQLINYGTQHIKPYGWRISLGMGAVPSLMLFFGAMMLPDTPNSLVQRGRPEEGRKVLQRIRGTDHVDTEVRRSG